MPTIKYYDTSTFKDLPPMAQHMGQQETLEMWAYPEPNYDEGVVLGEWWIETSLTDSPHPWTNYPSICMGTDTCIYDKCWAGHVLDDEGMCECHCPEPYDADAAEYQREQEWLQAKRFEL